jgi:hypothetical protein
MQPPAPPPGAPGGYGTPPAPPYGARPDLFVGYPQGGGFPAPMPPNMDPNYQDFRKRVEKWFTLAIVSVFCGCGLFGIINVVLAQQAKTSLERGDFADAESKLGVVRILCILGWVGQGLLLLFVLAYVVLIGSVIAMNP